MARIVRKDYLEDSGLCMPSRLKFSVNVPSGSCVSVSARTHTHMHIHYETTKGIMTGHEAISREVENRAMTQVVRQEED